jgi:hypothetical protein
MPRGSSVCTTCSISPISSSLAWISGLSVAAIASKGSVR